MQRDFHHRLPFSVPFDSLWAAVADVAPQELMQFPLGVQRSCPLVAMGDPLPCEILLTATAVVAVLARWMGQAENRGGKVAFRLNGSTLLRSRWAPRCKKTVLAFEKSQSLVTP